MAILFEIPRCARNDSVLRVIRGREGNGVLFGIPRCARNDGARCDTQGRAENAAAQVPNKLVVFSAAAFSAPSSPLRVRVSFRAQRGISNNTARVIPSAARNLEQNAACVIPKYILFITMQISNHIWAKTFFLVLAKKYTKTLSNQGTLSS